MYYYIINPASGNGKINKIQNKLKSKLREFNIAGDFVKTTGKGDALKLTKLALQQGYKTIVAVGGDNTVNEVAQGILNTNAVLGVIPIGNTNYLAKTLGIWTWEDSLKILAARKLETIDLGKIQNEEIEKYFITSCTIGFEANVIKKRSDEGFWNKIKFSRQVLSEIMKYKSKKATIHLEDDLVATSKIFTVIVANCKPIIGFKKTFQPNPQDSKLDILLVSEIPRLKALKNISAIVDGRYEDLIQTSIFQAKKIKIETEKKMAVAVDGEIVTKTPIEIEIIPKKLKVIVGKNRQF